MDAEHRRGLRARLVFAVLLGLLAFTTPASAQDLSCGRGDLEVRQLRFHGNETFSASELADSVVTTASSWARRRLRVLGTRRCLDPTELQRDVYRLALFYRRSGFYKARIGVDTEVLSPEAVAVHFRIEENPPVMLDSLVITGLGTEMDSARIVRGLHLRTGVRLDRYALSARVDEIVSRLRNSGYPFADVLIGGLDVDTIDMTAALKLDVQTGARAHINAVHVNVETLPGRDQQISEGTIRQLVGVRAGDLYRERDLLAAQRNLYQLDAYRHAEVRISPDSMQPPGDTLIVLSVGLIEGNMHSAQVGAGWATLDCFRTQGQYIHRNFLGGARRLELSARLWKIGIGAPLAMSPAPCARSVQEDPFSQSVNYYVSTTFRQPTFFGLGPRALPTITLYSERRSEYKAYMRSTPIGLLATRTWEPWRALPLSLSYQLEYGSTDAQPALFCAVFGVCDLADQAELRQERRLAVGGVALLRERIDQPFNPTSGSIVRVDMRHASPAIGSSPDVQFNKLVADGSRYWRVGDGQVLAARLRMGGVLGVSFDGTRRFIPPQERLYAGGPGSVRGYRQNELGPIIYVVDSFFVAPGQGDTVYYRTDADSLRQWGLPTIREAVPKGGNSLLVGNVEYRLRSPFLSDALQWTVFTDVGAVWNREDEGLGWGELRWTPGVGVRVLSVIGAVRVDVGYNPYQRRAGPVYYDSPPDATGAAPLYCVSPGNTAPVVLGRAPGDSGGCPATYLPPRSRNFFRQLNFNFSIGQAF